MCTRSVDRKYGVLLAAALAVLAAPHLARAQGYPTNFDFGAAASARISTPLPSQSVPTARVSRTAKATISPERKSTRALAAPVTVKTCRAWPDCRTCRPVRYYG
jgi:hypothetical protein